MNSEIQNIPIASIQILNPRSRDPKKFADVVESIKTLGLKKPIQVSRRTPAEADAGSGYDLVCGQGRIEAYIALGYTTIPAIVVEVSREDRLLRSLVENIARRQPSPRVLIQEIERLRAKGETQNNIAARLGLSQSLVSGLFTLKSSGEERLLDAALKGTVPVEIAIEISRAASHEAQRELLKAYQSRELNRKSIRVIKRMISDRQQFGKCRGKVGRPGFSASELVASYRREGERQQLLVKRARLCEAQLALMIEAFRELFRDNNFIRVLEREELTSMPEWLSNILVPMKTEV